METHDLGSWSDFAPLIQDIRNRYGAIKRGLPDGRSYMKKNQILFRGQTNNQWDLETTLERKTPKRFDVCRYMNEALDCVNELESFTGKRWDTKPFPEVRHEIETAQDPMRVVLPCYEYLVYLRHHGFPSPLLDWTESPYIAAYFAYCEQSSADRVAVYAFVERPVGHKVKRGGDAMITVEGPYATTHARHFAQKAWYTIATVWEKGHHFFCPHQRVFASTGISSDPQDVLVKITLPANERAAVLRGLNDYNINHFTLFQSEDALVKASAMRLFDMEDAREDAR